MRFFFDRNISVHIARMLAAFDRDNQITHQDEDGRFNPQTTDVELVKIVGSDQPRPVWVSADVRQMRNAPERMALAESGMTLIYIPSGFHDLSPHRQALRLLWVWPSIVTECKRCRQPTVFQIGLKLSSDKVERIMLTLELARP